MEAGPLKSEDQGLDLSVNICLRRALRASCVYCSLLLGHHPTLPRDVLLAKPREVMSPHVDLSFCGVTA
jgi:hypothetical protein